METPYLRLFQFQIWYNIGAVFSIHFSKQYQTQAKSVFSTGQKAENLNHSKIEVLS